MSFNHDCAGVALMRSASLPWAASPSPTVFRKRLELSGPAEAGRVTSIVRYTPGSKFHKHPHPDGEELLVISGVFEDEHGTYPAGSFLLNPEGFEHAPFSTEGCELFVKLRQFPGVGRKHVFVDTAAATEGEGGWRPLPGAPNVQRLSLYDHSDWPERIALLRLAAKARVSASQLTCACPPGPVSDNDAAGARLLELFVLSGDAEASGASLATAVEVMDALTWLRLPLPKEDADFVISTSVGATLYLKYGHLAPSTS